MNYREYIGKVGLKNISKEELVLKIEYLYELIESNRHSYQELIRDRDSKIESLINEKINYKDLYESIKKKFEESEKLQSDYDCLYKKWEEFSKCLDMGPEKFISMLDNLKEKIKNKANEITYLREQLKTSELDAKRYKNDGIQDRVKLQEVTEELEKVKKLMDTPCKEVKELIDNLKQTNDDKMDTISKLEATLFAVNKDKEMMLSYYAKELESIIKMRDNWKADCEYNEKCFQAERDRRWELEEEVKQLKKRLIESKVDNSDYIKNKKELDELVGKKLTIFEEPTLKVIGNDIDGYHNIYVNFLDELVFVDNVKNNLSSLKDSLMLVEFSATYAIKNIENGNYLYVIYKSNKNVEKLTHIEFVRSESPDTDCCKCSCSCKDCKKIYSRIYFTIGAERILIDAVPFWVDYWHYNIGEDSTKTRYVIARKDPMQKDLHNYAISKETLKVKVID